MTIKHENCPQCSNRGIVSRYVLDTKQDFTVPVLGELLKPINTRIQEEYCNCVWGFEKNRFDKKTESLDWVNSLEGLSDEQLLAWMDSTYENQQAINQEFS